MRESHLTVLVYVVAAVWALMLLARGTGLTPELAAPAADVPAVVLVVVALFDKRLWRVPQLYGWFVKVPDLRGTWKITLTPISGGENAGELVGFIVVRQTFSDIRVSLLTGESSSVSVAARVLEGGGDETQVTYVYRNEPRLSVRERSAIHYGTVRIRTTGQRPSRLAGEYWTDRGTRGEIASVDRVGKVVGSFAEAEGLPWLQYA